MDDVPFQIVAQRQTRDLDAANRLIDVMEVTFQIQTGSSRTIKVPIDAYEPEVVRRVVQVEANKMAEIDALGS